jgi:alpha-amylase
MSPRNEPLRLVLDLHCHQPIGNFGWVIEKATAHAYRPLLEALARHPRIPYVLHVSGPLLEWWLDHAKDMVELVRGGAHRGQIELQASGLYEPILPVLPRRDRVDQVRLHRAWLAELFGAEATSLWLTERVWEPSLPNDLAYAGIKSVVVDDTQFEGAGLKTDELDGFYATEDQGKVVRLFPISKRLRYLVPFRPVPEIVAFLKERHAAGQRLLVFGDDGEKFGLWPKTQEWVWGARALSTDGGAAKGIGPGWMEEFLAALESNAAWLKPTTLAETAAAMAPTDRVYLPTASYFELGHWSLPPRAQHELDALMQKLAAAKLDESARPFLRGATWRNFLARYPEAARLEQRMIRTSELTRQMGLRPPEGLQVPSQLHPAVRALFRGQCNCAYWHGVFGGLYLPFLRDAVIDELLGARAQLEAMRGDQEGAPHAEVADLDADGVDEVLLEGSGWSIWIAPRRGGMVDVLDHWPTRRNLANVIARRREAYHDGLLAKADSQPGAAAPASIHDLSIHLDGAEELLRYDPRPRGAFVLELAEPGADEGALAEMRGPDLHGVALVPLGLARPVVADRARADLAGTVELGARGSGSRPQLEVARSFEILPGRDGAGGELEASVSLKTSVGAARFTAALRFDLSVPGSGLDERFFELDGARRVRAGEAVDFAGESLELVDERGRFALESSRPFRAALRPIRTVSRSESGVDTCLQGSSLVLACEAELGAAEPWRWLVRLRPGKRSDPR